MFAVDGGASPSAFLSTKVVDTVCASCEGHDAGMSNDGP